MAREIEIGRQVEVGAGDHHYRVVEDWLKLPDGVTVQEIVAVACDAEGRAYVFNRGTYPIMIFDRNGHFVDYIDCGSFARPHGITIGPDGTIYCVDDFDHTVRLVSPAGGVLLTMGKSGEFSNTGATTIDYRAVRRGGPPFNYPTNLAVASSGELYVTDGYGNARVHRFTAAGRLLESWGQPGTGPGQFQVPHGIAISRDDIVYVADRENSRIQRFDLRGEFIDEWTDVIRPCEVFVAADGIVYIAELGLRAGRWPFWPEVSADAIGGRLSIFDGNGKLLARWGGGDAPCAPGNFFAPHDVWVDPFGDIYVSEVVWSAGANKGLVSPKCHTLQKFSRIETPS